MATNRKVAAAVDCATVKLEQPGWMRSSTAALSPAGLPRADEQTPCHMQDTNGGGSLEKVRGFDAYTARNAGLIVHGQAVTPGPKTAAFGLENVIGPVDSRVPVGDTTELPWRCIALLSITYESGATARGTAWFYGPRTLGTAGHNVRHPREGQATSILVSPAYDGANAPFGSYVAAASHCDPRWLDRADDPRLDYGVITLESPTPGQQLGWFGIAAYRREQLLPLLVNVSGYAGDLSPQTQYFNGGRLQGVTNEFLLYPFDTEAGMSGAPIFAMFGTQRIVVGIHTGGNNQANRARRIDSSLYAILRSFL